MFERRGHETTITLPPVAEENPLPQFIVAAGYDASTISYTDDNNFYEIGYVFKPLAAGKINSVTLQLPKAANVATIPHKKPFYLYRNYGIYRSNTIAVEGAGAK